MRKSIFALLSFAALLALPASALAQGGDSSIRGTVTDDSGAVLPGVTVTASSPALIQAETVVTDSQGTFRLLNLPVGEFTIEASLSGFATSRQEGILVRASTNIAVDIAMAISSVQETITVTAETPMLEVTRPGNILTIEGEFQRDLPIQARGNWSDFLEMTPGVNARPFDDGSGRMVYFGHATEHFAHVIQLEGMAAAGYNDSQITYVGMGADMIEDASVKTGGAEAKDPMGTGLIINIVTKSGGNDLSASAAYDRQEYAWGTGDEDGLGGFFGDNDLPDGFDPFASEKANFASMGVYEPPDTVNAGAGSPTAHLVSQADFSLGGPLMRDKAWFYATYRYADLAARISRSALDINFLNQLSGLSLASGLGTSPTYSAFPNTTKSHQPYVKLTAQLSANHELSGYYQRDQLNNTSNREYDIAPRYVVKTGGDLFGAKLTSVFGDNTTGQFLASWNNKAAEVNREAQPQFDSIPLYLEIHNGFDVNSSGTTANGGRIAAMGTGNGTVRPTRLLLLRADLTHYLDDVAGSHEIGFGVYAAPWNRYPQTTVYSNFGGWRSEWHAPVDANGDLTADLSQAVGTVWYRRLRSGDANGAADELKTRDARDRDIAFYLQDAWKPTDRLTLNIGVRADFVKRYDGVRDLTRMDTLALGPRAGFSYMLTSDARTVLRGSYGRVHEQMNGRDNITSSHSGASIGSYNEYDHDGDGVPDHSIYTPPSAGIPAEYLFDPEVGQPFVDEFIGGVRQQFAGQFAMDVAVVHRRYQDNYAYLEQNGFYPESAPAPVPLGEFQFGRVPNIGLDYGTINQQTNNSWSQLVYTALEITSTRRTDRMSATLNINRQWQHYNGDWNPNDPARYISPEKFNNNKALNMPRGNNEHNSLPTSSYSPTWRQFSVRGGVTYSFPWDITAGVSYTANAGPWSGPITHRYASDDPIVAQYGPGQTNNGRTNPLSTRYRLVGQDRGDLQVQAPTVHTVGMSIGKTIDFGAAQLEVTAQVFNLMDAYNHNQYTYSSANRTYSPNFLQLRSRQNARTLLIRTNLRF